jgi:hypothetical protein
MRCVLLKGVFTGHQWFDKFSIAVAGSGTLLGMFVTEGMDRYFCATWYDRSDHGSAAIKQELALENAKLTSPRYHRLHPSKPAPTDVTVSFKTAGDLEMVTVIGGTYRRTLSFPTDFGKGGEASLKAMIDQILQAVAAAP